jgi:RimJ/RimL family protein N-acetyltransferase
VRRARRAPQPLIRPALPDDAAALLELKRTLDRETEFMLLEPDERVESPEDLAREIADTVERPNSTILIAQEDALLGYAQADGGRYRRNRHCAYVVIGVRAAAAGHGIGTALLRALHEWTAVAGVHRLELTVMAHNEPAIGLYRKCGYEVEGRRRDAIRVGEDYVDELFMAWLQPTGSY